MFLPPWNQLLLVCLFARGDPLLNGADTVRIELRLPVEVVDAVLFRVYVGQLCIAVAEHVGIVKQDITDRLEPPVKILDRYGIRAIAPAGLALQLVLGGGLHRYIGIPLKPPELAYEIGLAAIRNRPGRPGGVRAEAVQIGIQEQFSELAHRESINLEKVSIK